MSNSNSFLPCLSIAALDPCSYAGCSADLRTFNSVGCHGFSALTAVTLQSPSSFRSLDPIDPAIVSEQIHVVFDSFGPLPSKIGLIPSLDCLLTIGNCLDAYDFPTAVLDPVLSPSADPQFRFCQPLLLAESLFPRVTLVTPNIPEAETLLGCSIDSLDAMMQASFEIHSTYGCAVLIKGGHLNFLSAADVFCSKGDPHLLESPRAELPSARGSGCFLSASITAFSALGFDLETAVRMAKGHISKAFANPVDVQGFPLLSSRP